MSKTFSVQDVASLNKRIEQLNVEGTRTETKIAMLTEQLTTGLSEYERQYGVNLSGKTLRETAELIKREYGAVLTTISEEYELKSKIVEAIQRNDIDEANRLLGINSDVTAEEPEVAVKQEAPNASLKESPVPPASTVVEEDPSGDFDEDDSDYGVGSVDTNIDDTDVDIDDDDEDEVSYDDEDYEVVDAEEYGLEIDEDSGEGNYAGIDEEDFDLEEEDNAAYTGRVSDAAAFMKAVQEQQLAFTKQKSGVKKTTGSESGSIRVTKPVSGSSVVATVKALGGDPDFDIDLNDDEDFGFGDTLKGSKFVPKNG